MHQLSAFKLTALLLLLAACERAPSETIGADQATSENTSELTVKEGNLTITDALRYTSSQVFITITNTSKTASQAWAKTYPYTAGSTLGSGMWPCAYVNDAANRRITISRTQPANSTSTCQITLSGSGAFDAIVAPSAPSTETQAPSPNNTPPTTPPTTTPPIAGWSSAPDLGTVTYTADDDSVIFDLPAVAGAADYRVISLATNPTVT